MDAIPSEFRQPAFAYSFDIVNVDSLSAVALPGGPMFLGRGMIEAARTEGKLAGVMAHQLSHIVLRHGTAQATATDRFQIGQITGRDIGEVVGGAADGITAAGVAFGLSSHFLKYSQAHEHQADLLAALVMARSGYDPAHLAGVFHTIEDSSNFRGGPQWMSSHPNPGDRDQYILREALQLQGLPVATGALHPYLSSETQAFCGKGPLGSTGEFDSMQALLKNMPPAPTTEEVARAQRSGIHSEAVPRMAVPVPSGDYRSASVGATIHLSVPANWHCFSGGHTVMFASDGAGSGSEGCDTAFTHGIQVGVARSLTGDLLDDTKALLDSLGQVNPRMRWVPAYQRITIGGRSGLTTALTNVPAWTRQFEYVTVSTIRLSGSNYLYVIGMAPQHDTGTYRRAFDRILETIETAR